MKRMPRNQGGQGQGGMGDRVGHAQQKDPNGSLLTSIRGLIADIGQLAFKFL